MSHPHALLKFAQGFLDFFSLNGSQVLAVGDKRLDVVSTAMVYMLQNLHGQVPELLVLLRKVVLDQAEDVTQIDLFSCIARNESFINDMHGEAGDLCLAALHTLNKLWIEESGLTSLNHNKENLSADVPEVGFVSRCLFQ